MKLLLYDARVQWASAVFLALVAGYLDGYGLLFLGTYVSFMSGNTTFAGLKGRLRRYFGEGRDCGLLGGIHARRTRHQRLFWQPSAGPEFGSAIGETHG
jgi:Protein of unknown function (DUF1275)